MARIAAVPRRDENSILQTHKKAIKYSLDKDLKTHFPFDIDRQKMMAHKIIVAHGAKEACENFSKDNVYGSLAISYGPGEDELSFPFMIHMIPSENPYCNSVPQPITDRFLSFSIFLTFKEHLIFPYHQALPFKRRFTFF